MGPGFESLKVHQEKRDARLHLFFLATFMGGEPSVRPIAKQWHEPRRGEVVPESLLLHSSFSLVALSGEEPHPNDGTGENEPLFSDVGSPRQRRHEPRRDEVVPESSASLFSCYFCGRRTLGSPHCEAMARGAKRRSSPPESAHTPQGVYFMPVLSCSPRRRRRGK